MPELPDIEIYIEALERRIFEEPIERLRIASPFLLRTVDPPIESIEGRTVQSIQRMGKRIVLGFEEQYFLVLHLMIAGRLHWKPPRVRLTGKTQLAAFDFPSGTLLLTESGSKKRASLHLLQGAEALAQLDPGGADPFSIDLATFHHLLRNENRTLKRALTNPRIFSGIGNAFSDEILHRAKLSPLTWTRRLADEEVARLFNATRATLSEWTSRLREKAGEDFPEKVTAFRPEMAVHGRFGQPCPVCGVKVERIVYAENESNYCPRCQTGGRRLADRSLSRLLKDAFPRDIDEE
ncbi:MAG: DNA-formamidopyrimidine glycosylase family protein [Planctomycetota bacterium]